MTSWNQLRAARALKGLSQADLAQMANVSTKTIKRAEAGEPTVAVDTVERIRRSLEKAGVIFIESNGDGPGVRLRK